MLWPSPKDKWLPDTWKKNKGCKKLHQESRNHTPEDCEQYEERVSNSTISTEKFFMGSVESTAAEDEWATTQETNRALIN